VNLLPTQAYTLSNLKRMSQANLRQLTKCKCFSFNLLDKSSAKHFTCGVNSKVEGGDRQKNPLPKNDFFICRPTGEGMPSTSSRLLHIQNPMSAKSLEQIRLEYNVFDLLPTRVRHMISNADTLPGDVVEATAHAMLDLGYSEEQVLEVLQQRLTYYSSKRGT